jgi:hypothetical protein
VISHDRQSQTIEDPQALLKPLDVSTSRDLTCAIMKFLDLIPMVLFYDAPTDAQGRDEFFEEHLASFIACLANDDEYIRQLANNVSRKVMTELCVHLLSNPRQTPSEGFSGRFWRTT